AVIKKIKELHKKGQPVLVGTTSIEKNELLHKLLKKEKIPHSILNAKQHEQEAQVIARAGKKGAVTVATNMAGRGVDIKIDDEVKALGGLFILGTERHESRRIDNQLRGRAGRQGDPGASQFFLSLDDSLLRIFGGDRIKNIMNRLGVKEGEHIESKMVTRAVEKAQKKVEALHFESRKHILEYDDVANEQRKTIYKFRNELLNPEFDIDSKIKENRRDYIEELLNECEIFPEAPKDDYNLEKLTLKLKEELKSQFSTEELKDKEYDELKEYIIKKLEEEYEKKMSAVEDSQRREIERILYLQILDNGWRDHLYQMDILKTGIGLRGYNQKDPLVEYKKESFTLFVELVKSIKNEIIKTLHIIELRDEKEEEIKRLENELKKVEEELKSQAVLQHKEEVESKPTPITNTKKPKRNEPCPCGSGKKYKHCCGKSGPKKGVLAKEST
ncbi:MAG TPA: preprotein translocase subunit SecA, partial [Campylobacterales bacterium]|nr:preprotein translocase subunit SecA [Campylobacterales bacterium]